MSERYVIKADYMEARVPVGSYRHTVTIRQGRMTLEQMITKAREMMDSGKYDYVALYKVTLNYQRVEIM
jgi:hypothetical protein